MSEIKTCPVCGEQSSGINTELSISPTTSCDNPNCWMYGIAFHIDAWQQRPIEDALRSELDKLREQIKQVREIAEEAQGEWSCIEVPYAPEWTMPYRDILNVLPQPPEEV